MVQTMQNRMQHIHVSGENKMTNHSLLYQADNGRKIVDFIRKCQLSAWPIIDEGRMLNAETDIQEEIRFLKEFT